MFIYIFFSFVYVYWNFYKTIWIHLLIFMIKEVIIMDIFERLESYEDKHNLKWVYIWSISSKEEKEGGGCFCHQDFEIQLSLCQQFCRNKVKFQNNSIIKHLVKKRRFFCQLAGDGSSGPNQCGQMSPPILQLSGPHLDFITFQ